MSTKMKKCVVCGEEIATSAKSCPKCGARNKKPIYKKWWFWGVIVVILLAMASSGGGDETIDEATITEGSETGMASTASTAVEIYQRLANNTDPGFAISEKSLSFIEAHTDFFPGDESIKGAISDYVDEDITYAHLSKNISKYGDSLICVYGYVVDIEESEDSSITYLHIVDYDGQSYTLYYLGALDDVFEESEVYVYALPFAMTVFENLSGAYTEAVTGAASYVEVLY